MCAPRGDLRACGPSDHKEVVWTTSIERLRPFKNKEIEWTIRGTMFPSIKKTQSFQQRWLTNVKKGKGGDT
jgi:hypothetical protein